MADRQAQIPGGEFINETGTRQAQIPGDGFVNETAAAAAQGSALLNMLQAEGLFVGG